MEAIRPLTEIALLPIEVSNKPLSGNNDSGALNMNSFLPGILQSSVAAGFPECVLFFLSHLILPVLFLMDIYCIFSVLSVKQI